MSRFGFLFASSILVVSTAIGACSNIADDCENTGTCPPAGGAGAGGTTSGGKGGTPVGGNSSSGSSNAGEAGNAAGGSSSAGTGGSTAGGEAGAGGGGVALPCDGACSGPKPVCDEPSDRCVECLQEADCAAGAKKKCDTDAKACVACLESADCSTAAAAKCDAGACAKCTSNDDCSHIAGKGVCDGGTCVQCTTADEVACAGKSCNPATKACTTTTVGSASTCKPCVADSECTGGNQADPDARCVPLEFQGSPRSGGFCLRRAAKTCGRPYTVAISAKSLSGVVAENYCGIDQQNVTCEAVIDLEDSRTCAAQPDSACGCLRDAENKCVGAGQGGLCRDFAVLQGQCTYQCGIANHCPEGLSCTGSPTKYCQ